MRQVTSETSVVQQCLRQYGVPEWHMAPWQLHQKSGTVTLPLMTCRTASRLPVRQNHSLVPACY